MKKEGSELEEVSHLAFVFINFNLGQEQDQISKIFFQKYLNFMESVERGYFAYSKKDYNTPERVVDSQNYAFLNERLFSELSDAEIATRISKIKSGLFKIVSEIEPTLEERTLIYKTAREISDYLLDQIRGYTPSLQERKLALAKL